MSPSSKIIAPQQPASSGKRHWNDPAITDEDVRNTAAKGPQPTEFTVTNGPGS